MDPEEEYILVIDADMIMRSPFFPKAMGVAPGTSRYMLASKQTQALTTLWCMAGSVVQWFRAQAAPNADVWVTSEHTLQQQVTGQPWHVIWAVSLRLGRVCLLWLPEGCQQ